MDRSLDDFDNNEFDNEKRKEELKQLFNQVANNFDSYNIAMMSDAYANGFIRGVSYITSLHGLEVKDEFVQMILGVNLKKYLEKYNEETKKQNQEIFDKFNESEEGVNEDE